MVKGTCCKPLNLDFTMKPRVRIAKFCTKAGVHPNLDRELAQQATNVLRNGDEILSFWSDGKVNYMAYKTMEEEK
jgi:hypothetical protein